MPRWSEQMTLKFVELYEQHELLWNIHNEDYKNRDARQSALENIVEIMCIDGFTVADAKNKIKSLRCTYNQEHIKIQKSLSSGAGADEAYKPQVKWFSAMANVMELGNLIGDSLCIQVREDQSSTLEIDENETELVSPSREEMKREPESTTEKVRVSRKQKRVIPPPHSNKKSLYFQKIADTVKELKTLNDSLNKAEPQPNECDVFGNHISTQLKHLTPHSCILAQGEIQNILTKYRVADLRAEGYNQSPPD